MFIEIIPNWHPIFVHFTIGLLSISTLFFILGFFSLNPWKEKCLLVARWNLWIGTFITIGTLLAGWHAYNTVSHDGPSHAAMTDHRNWALATATAYILLVAMDFIYRKKTKRGLFFMGFLLISSGLLAITGYKGGELVYRYGLGVMSLPQAEAEDMEHNHSEGKNEHGGEEHEH